jgi:hypothetical protein
VDSSTKSDVGDVFAGCFLSLAGSLVGAVISAVILVVRMFPNIRIPELILGFVAGFVGGVVVGAIATFAAGRVALLIGGSHAENIWIAAVAVTAGIGAAVTALLLIPV